MIEENKTLFADGFDEAMLGITDDSRIVYSKVQMLEILVSRDEMSVEEAIEFLEYNTWNTYVGDYTPIYVNDFDSDAEEIEQYLTR
jgi:hypothetical protein